MAERLTSASRWNRSTTIDDNTNDIDHGILADLAVKDITNRDIARK
jgi:hypothetical protein